MRIKEIQNGRRGPNAIKFLGTGPGIVLMFFHKYPNLPISEQCSPVASGLLFVCDHVVTPACIRCSLDLETSAELERGALFI